MHTYGRAGVPYPQVSQCLAQRPRRRNTIEYSRSEVIIPICLWLFMAYKVMAYIFMADVVMAYVVLASRSEVAIPI